jgi:hypothetical protein
MLYSEHPTPPFNSPYQTHASRSDSLLESPYLSPNRNESLSKYPHGLGLYDYHHQIPTTLPPSPSPSDSWSGHVSTGASPLMTQAIADPWTSGAFEHPVTRSPQPWGSAQVSPRSSLSSAAVTPIYSHTGPDNPYREMNTVKLEGHGWATDTRYGQDGSALPSSRHHPLTVAPERLNTTLVPYDNAYGSAQMTRLEPTTALEYESRNYGPAPSEGSPSSQSDYPNTSAHRQRGRNRKHTDPAKALFRCNICPDKGFARQYNWKQHMLTHDPLRKKEHVCPWADCGRAFVRKTDLNRHDTSVHLKMKAFICSRCPSKFARKDTCSR